MKRMMANKPLMNHRRKGELKTLIILVSSLVTGIAITKVNHNSYWDGTIRRVQTVDFNILSHTLPARLSTLLIAGNHRKIQEVINSNYGLFRIAITDRVGQRVIFVNQRRSRNGEWVNHQVNSNELSSHPYNELRDPVPLYAEWKFESSRALSPKNTQYRNSGQVIGRVYYLRVKTPSFQNVFVNSINPFYAGDGFRNPTIPLTMVAALFGGVALSSIIRGYDYRQLQKAVEFEEREQEYRSLINQKIEENERLIQAETPIDRAALEQDNLLLKEEIKGHSPSPFEYDVTERLMALEHSSCISEFDCGYGRGRTRENASKFLDNVLFADNCIIAIEVKSHTGRIYSIGDGRNEEWYYDNKQSRGTRQIHCCQAVNPLKQVKVYTNSLRSKLQFQLGRKRRDKINPWFYGIVIFPNAAIIEDSIPTEAGKFYTVTTIGQLEEVISTIIASCKGVKPVPYEFLRDIMLGRPIRAELAEEVDAQS